jgi:hypothetical protein
MKNRLSVQEIEKISKTPQFKSSLLDSLAKAQVIAKKIKESRVLSKKYLESIVFDI